MFPPLIHGPFLLQTLNDFRYHSGHCPPQRRPPTWIEDPAQWVGRPNSLEARLRRPEVCPVLVGQDQRLFGAIVEEPSDYGRLA